MLNFATVHIRKPNLQKRNKTFLLRKLLISAWRRHCLCGASLCGISGGGHQRQLAGWEWSLFVNTAKLVTVANGNAHFLAAPINIAIASPTFTNGSKFFSYYETLLFWVKYLRYLRVMLIQIETGAGNSGSDNCAGYLKAPVQKKECPLREKVYFRLQPFRIVGSSQKSWLVTPWRNGSTSDSRSEGFVFDHVGVSADFISVPL